MFTTLLTEKLSIEWTYNHAFKLFSTLKGGNKSVSYLPPIAVFSYTQKEENNYHLHTLKN